MKNRIKNLLVIIPAYNEYKTIKNIILKVKKIADVLVIDDNSTDTTYKISKKYSNYTIKNNCNKGYDASLFKGFRFVFKNFKKYDYIITMDGDGQHKAKYIKLLYKKIIQGKYDCIIGKRDKYNRVSESICSFFSAPLIGISDPFSGMRCYDLKKLKLCFSRINKKKRYGGLFLFYLDLRNYELKISVNENKDSKFGRGLITHLSLIKYFLQLSFFRIIIK